ncbi:hypothetical protein QFZ52_000111 [Arthrobacter woluwensis]|uniref:hypothetical protein n=1 Tax=Arthrobacter woluwensis TaxID=156980 RepID=UPI00277E01F0|nr:hypothetical protein [Arthrobacter woluwensis]MDQ0707459.1 hypothetical protein [Arthrobacter woluwensis]
MTLIKKPVAAIAGLLAGALFLGACAPAVESDPGTEKADLSKLKDEFYKASDPGEEPGRRHTAQGFVRHHHQQAGWRVPPRLL